MKLKTLFNLPNLSILPVCISTTSISISLYFDNAVISIAPENKGIKGESKKMFTSLAGFGIKSM